MKKLLYILILGSLSVFAQTNTENYILQTSYQTQFTGGYDDFSMQLNGQDLFYSNNLIPLGIGQAQITIANNILTFEIQGQWDSDLFRLKTGLITQIGPLQGLTIELGELENQLGSTGYFAKIANGDLQFYQLNEQLSNEINTLTTINFTSATPIQYASNFDYVDCFGSGLNNNFGNIHIDNDSITLELAAQMSQGCFLKLGLIQYLDTSPIPDVELGFIMNGLGEPTEYKAKIVNNWLVFYSDTHTVLEEVQYQHTLSLIDIGENDMIKTITYFDGIGRPKQSVKNRGGGNKQDIIIPFTYDSFGRQIKQYLPFSDPLQTDANVSLDFRVQDDVFFTNLNDKYLAKYGSDLDPIAPNPFSEKVLENSPLNRMLERAAPGSDWALGNGHTIKMEYLTNGVDEVRRYIVHHPDIDKVQTELICDGFYTPNELYKMVTKDENWVPSTDPTTINKNHTIEEFRNKQGQVLLKRTYNENQAYDTYYVYDDFGNLSFVLSPKSSDNINVLTLVNTSGVISQEAKSWIDIVNVDKAFAKQNDKKLKALLKDKALKKAELENMYNGVGGFNLLAYNDGTYSINIDISTDIPVALKVGTVAKFSKEFKIKDEILGTIQDANYEYSFKIQNNALVVDGVGELTSLNQVFFTMPPTVNCDIDLDVLEGLSYQYHYDYRNRLVEKKIPGKAWEYVVYDKLDRPVLTQDANLRATNDWLFTKYDGLGRVIYTGKHHFVPTGLDDNSGRLELQDDLNALTDFKEERVAHAVVIGDMSLYYSNTAFPSTDLEIFTVNYYDDYPIDISTEIPNIGSFDLAGETHHISMNTKSLPTGSKVRVLGTNNWIISASYYDEKGRPIYAGSINLHLISTDIIKSALDFTGKVIETESYFKKHISGDIVCTSRCVSNAHFEEIVISDVFSYDHQNRLTKQVQAIKTTNGAHLHLPEVIVLNTYDELGQLIEKNVGGLESAANQLQSVDYTYNIRGWLTAINNDVDNDNDLFDFKLNYNTIEKAGSTPLFNGNISESHWSTVNDNNLRSYSYHYDALNRITSAQYHGDYQVASTVNLDLEDYSLNGLSYDKNGNIQGLNRTGLITGTAPEIDLIDDLSYLYKANSNQLTSVSDTATGDGFKNGTNSFGDDYTYDANGNLLSDKNKQITHIEYNHLNLPTTVHFTFTENINILNAGTIGYIYDATGVKLSKIVSKSGLAAHYLPVTTQYAGNFIYEGTPLADMALQFFSHPEGYVEPSFGIVNNYRYIYQYKDHLGNIRLSYADEAGLGTNISIREESNYYPFGLKHKGYNNVVVGRDHKYGFGGKEEQDELGLNMLDFHARNYMADLGRWGNLDPLSEQYYDLSAYSYVANNPLIYTDPDGQEIVLGFKKDKEGNRIGKKGVEDNINSGLGDVDGDFAQIDGDGNLTIDITAEQRAALTTEQASFLATLEKGINLTDADGNNLVVNIDVVSGSEDVFIGKFETSEIDIADVNAFKGNEVRNENDILQFEVNEQIDKTSAGDDLPHRPAHDSSRFLLSKKKGNLREPGNEHQQGDVTVPKNLQVHFSNMGKDKKTIKIKTKNNNIKSVK